MPLINFSGLASGIDSEALISATSDASRATRVNPKKRKVIQLEATNEALAQLNTNLGSIKSILGSFTTAFGGPLAKQASTSDNTILTASASNSATNGTYEITVQQKAKNATASLKSNLTHSSPNDPIGAAINMIAPDADRTVTIEIGLGAELQSIPIVLTDETTLSEFAGQINDATTNAIATVINVGTSSAPDYRVVVTTTKVGTSEGSIAISIGSEIALQQIFDDNLISQATDAQITVSGIGSFSGGSATITRSTNTITDIIPGVTLELLKEAVGAVTISVSNDIAATSSKIQSFVDAYNELVKYLDEANQIVRNEEGENVSNTFGPLATTRVDDNALSAIRNAISASKYEDGVEVRIFADLGITTEQAGTLKFDPAVLKTALENEPDSVNNIMMTFADLTSVTEGSIDVYTRFGGIISLAKDGNEAQIKSLNDQIAQAEQNILRQEQTMRLRFARLEQLVSRLQSQQSALSSVIASISG